MATALLFVVPLCSSVVIAPYADYVRSTGADLSSKFCVDVDAWPVSHQHVNAECAALAAELFRLNHSAVHHEQALANLWWLANETASTRVADFFTPFPTLHALRTLNAAGRSVPPPLEAGLRRFAEAAFRPAPQK